MSGPEQIFVEPAVELYKVDEPTENVTEDYIPVEYETAEINEVTEVDRSLTDEVAVKKKGPNGLILRDCHIRYPFRFEVESQEVAHTFTKEEFEELSSKDILLWAIGQASTFTILKLEQVDTPETPDEYFREYLRKWVNRGQKSDVEVTPRSLTRLLKEVVKEGLASNGSSRHRLTPKAIEVLCPEAVDQSDLIKSAETATKYTPQYKLIKPQDLPAVTIIRNGRKRVILDKDRQASDIYLAKKYSLQTLEILSELELAKNYTIESKNLGAEIKSRIQQQSYGATYTYNHAIRLLAESGYVELNNIDNKVRLTSEGIGLIAMLKNHSEHIRGEYMSKPGATIILQIIELLSDQIGIDLDSLESSENLPDATDWLYSANNTESIYPNLANAMNKEESNIIRRICEMRDKNYIKTIPEVREARGAETKNIQVLKGGLEYAISMRRRLREKEDIVDTAKVDEAQEFVQACIHLAKQIDDQETASTIRENYDSIRLLELSDSHLHSTRVELESLFNKLKQDYIAIASRAQAA